MTPSQITRTINWVAMPVALLLFAIVGYYIYQRHFVEQQAGLDYRFSDLPKENKAPVTADIESIVSKHVFGVVPSAPEPQPVVVKAKPVVKDVPKTALNIKLTGIIDGSTPENGMAMLEVDRGRTLVVAVGEMIGKTDALLAQVLPGEVLIDRDGTLESVKMVRKTLSLARLDPELESNLPQPYVEGDDGPAPAEQETSSGVPEANSNQLEPGYSSPEMPVNNEAARSTMLNRINRMSGSNRGNMNRPKEGAPRANLPIPRALRN